MIFCILFVLFALYKCTINVKHCKSPENNHEESQHIQRTDNQPKQLKRSYIDMTKTEERKRTKIAIKNDCEVLSNSSSAKIAGNSLDVSAYCQNIDLDQFDAYNLGDSIHAHDIFDHSFNIDPLQLQDDKKHIADNIMTSDNALDDLLSVICASYDSEIQKMTAEPEFINVYNDEENTYTFLGHQFDMYNLGDSVNPHNKFDQSCSIGSMPSQDDMTHIFGSTITNNNPPDDLISEICAPYDSDIQKMTAEPGFINDYNDEENTYTFLGHQSVIPQDLTATQCDHFDTYNSVGNAFTDQQVCQDETTISTINIDRHTYQNLDIFGNLFPPIDADELEHTITNDNCPMPTNTCSSQNTTLDVEGGLDRVQNITISGEVQNDEKITCPATLTLSFLSFRLFQTNKSLSTDQNNVIIGKGVDSDEIDGTSQPSCKEQKHNVSNFVYNCKINLDENEPHQQINL